LAAKVVYVPKYPVDRDGRIHGNGHPIRDIVEWSIPVLWPIDLINLPRRGPRPVLKEETRLTLKIMDDLVVPTMQQQPRDPYGFSHRAPTAYEPPPPPPQPQQQQPIAYNYAPPPPPPPQVVQVYAPPVTVLVMRNGYGLYATSYWFQGGGQIRYVAVNGSPYVISTQQLDIASTIAVNRQRGIAFNVPYRGF
jgi:hypothetical protein